MKSIRLLVFVLLTVLLAHNVNAQNNALQKVELAYKIISTFYVDSVNNEQLAADAIKGMLNKLDPHSDYLSKEEVKKLNEPLGGSFNGIGIQFGIINDTLTVVSPIQGGPSYKVGIVAGDKIINIDGNKVAGVGIHSSGVFKYLRGKRGSKVNLKIYRRGVPNLIAFTVVRDKIPIHSVVAAYMATSNIAYVKINEFSLNTKPEFVDALKNLKEQGMKSLIIDLRGNPGGYLSAATGVANELLDAGKRIVYTQGRISPKREYHSNAKGIFKTGKVVVLVDEGTASASEIVSGSIQDWDRGLIIGRRSFGKGLVQRPFNLRDGSMVKLTIAKYYTPSGRCIQKPYIKGDKKDYNEEVYKRLLHGEGYVKDSIHLNTKEKYFTNNKRIVYGGGGIMPDVFVPMDTTGFSIYYRNIVALGVLNKFVSSYADVNRVKLKKRYRTFKQFNKKFVVDNTMINNLVKQATKDSIKYDEKGLNISKDFMKIQIKALVASSLWDVSRYVEVLNPSINVYRKAIEILNDDKKYNSLLGGQTLTEKNK